MLLIFFYSAMIAVFAVVYKNVLSYEPVLNWWFQFGMKYEKRCFYKPIWGCEKCFAGQLAAWIYIFNWASHSCDRNAPFWRFIFFLIPKYPKGDYNLFLGAVWVSLTILLTIYISKQLNK